MLCLLMLIHSISPRVTTRAVPSRLKASFVTFFFCVCVILSLQSVLAICYPVSVMHALLFLCFSLSLSSVLSRHGDSTHINPPSSGETVTNMIGVHTPNVPLCVLVCVGAGGCMGPRHRQDPVLAKRIQLASSQSRSRIMASEKLTASEKVTKTKNRVPLEAELLAVRRCALCVPQGGLRPDVHVGGCVLCECMCLCVCDMSHGFLSFRNRRWRKCGSWINCYWRSRWSTSITTTPATSTCHRSLPCRPRRCHRRRPSKTTTLSIPLALTL
jgi:hypothetical protein